MLHTIVMWLHNALVIVYWYWHTVCNTVRVMCLVATGCLRTRRRHQCLGQLDTASNKTNQHWHARLILFKIKKFHITEITVSSTVSKHKKAWCNYDKLPNCSPYTQAVYCHELPKHKQQRKSFSATSKCVWQPINAL